MSDAHPTRASSGWPQRQVAGVSLHFSSLPGTHGIGDIGDAAVRFVQRLAATRLTVWQVLPTGPTGYGDSPYQSLSAFAGNEMLIGLEPLVREDWLHAREITALAALPRESVDFGRLIPLKRRMLEQAADRFLERAGANAAFEDFVARHDRIWLHDYALFRVLKTVQSERPWTQWEPELSARDSGALLEAERQHRDAILRVKAMQFFFDRQWAVLRRQASECGVRLFGDMPFYIALDSADAWAGRALLLADAAGRPSAVAGVPPDYFSEDGQLWGNPLYDWAHHAATGYRWWIARLAAAARHHDMIRVDHFRGFESYWSVPAGAETAREGEWKPGPGDALFDAVADALGAVPVVAEDLGVITGEVEQLRKRHGIPGMKVLQFELADRDFDPSTIAEDCVVYTATHDNDTTAGWFSGGAHDPRSRKEIRRTGRNALRLTRGKARTIAHDLVRLAFSTPARVAIAPMQDYLGLGSEARMNVPGTGAGNWRWRLSEAQLTEAKTEQIAGLVVAGERD